MILELKEDSPLYGKKGTVVDESILKVIPPKHHSLFIKHVRKVESRTYEYSYKPLDITDLERYLNEARNRPQPDPAEPAEEIDDFNPFTWGDVNYEEWNEDDDDEEEENENI